ncbi:MAG: hypothetical protein ACKV2T_25210 [Kofleriaceae bacterium]
MIKSTLILLGIAACGSASTSPTPSAPASREMRASEHKAAAMLHAARAAELARISDALGEQPIKWKDDPKTGLWFRSLSEERQADAHLAIAAQLETDFRERCGDLPRELVEVSPLQRFSTGGMPKPNGVIVFLEPAAGPPERLLRELRCHQAWMKLGEAPAAECALEIVGIDLTAYGDATGISVEIATQDPASVAELQRRTQHVIETGRHAQRRGK